MRTDQVQEQADLLTRTIARVVRRLFTLDPDDPSAELPLGQLRVCSTLRDGPRTMSCLSRELGISLSAVTQIMGRLERSGLVERLSETDDRRVKSVRLSSVGSRIMDDRQKQRVERTSQVLQKLSTEDREAIVSAITRLLDASMEDDASPELFCTEQAVG